MPEFFNHLTEILNRGFDVLDLILVRTTILGLAFLGARALLKKHP